MGPLIIVVNEPVVQILLELIHVFIELFPKGHLIKFLQDGFMETLTDSVGLRRLGLGVINIIDGQV